VEALKPGGRLAVIAFHSLEDRIVKQTFRRESRDCICPPEQPICTCGHRARLREVNRQPITAGEDEISANTRSRSAKLRIVEKLNLA
jgi:16S rRNA (cytosine1402-N4)-methyltransferase